MVIVITIIMAIAHRYMELTMLGTVLSTVQCPSVSTGSWFQDVPSTKIQGCASPVCKMVWHLHIFPYALNHL
jgi:hypothetical protein